MPSRPATLLRLARSRHAPWLVAAVALCTHVLGVLGGYTFDDVVAVLGHPAVTGAVGLSEVFTREFWGRPLGAGWSSSYRPLTTLTFALTHRLTPAPWLHHLVNLTAYAALCALVVVFLRRHMAIAQATVAGLLFALWPIHVDNVASIVGRADILAGGFALLALLAAERTDPAPRMPEAPVDAEPPGPVAAIAWARSCRQATFAAVAYLLAMLCKEGVALLPGIAAWLLVVRWRRPNPSRPHPRSARWLVEALPVLALAAAGVGYLVVRQAWLPVGLPRGFVGADNVVHGLSGVTRWWANLSLLGTYSEIATVPLRLCADHTYGDVMPPDCFGPLAAGAWRAWLGVVLCAAVVWDGWRAWRGRGAGLGVAFALAYLLVGQWVIDLSVTFAERLFLWPSVFAAGALVAAIATLLAAQPQATQRRLHIAFVLLGLLYAGRSAQRTLDWRTPLTLYASSARSCPAAVHNRVNLAKAWQHANRPDEALWHYAVALAGHRAWPGHFSPPAFAAEHTTPLAERLRRLPELVDLGGTPAQVWPALVRWLRQRGAEREAQLATRLGTQTTASPPASPPWAPRP
mgnify:FL=1